jgi:hypothetical protein
MVAFDGDGEGVGELTWSQANLWQGMTLDGPPITMGGIVQPPDGMTVERIEDLLRFAVTRHQSLRTRLRLRGDRPPLQVCVTSGVVPLDVIDAGDDDPAALAKAIEAEYKRKPFDYENEFPVRMAVVHRAGAALRMVGTYLHLAMDQGGVDALMRDLDARDPVTGAAAGPVTSVQPLELANKQAGAHAQRKSAAAMTYLEHVLRVMPIRQFGEPRYPDDGRRIIRFRSPATALAIRRIAAQETTSTASALLAAFAVGVARFSGHPNMMAMLLVHNRFRPGLADSVSPVVQMSPCLIEVRGAPSLRDVVARTGASVLTAYKHAYYDPYQQDVVFDRVEAERGPLEYWHYNDRRDMERPRTDGPLPTDDEIRAAVAHSEHSLEPNESATTSGIFLSVLDEPNGGVDFVLDVATRYLSETEMVALTAEFEVAAVRTALEPTAPTDFAADSPKYGEHRPDREVIHHA